MSHALIVIDLQKTISAPAARWPWPRAARSYPA